MEQYIKKSDIVSEIESLKRSTFTNFDEGVNCVVQTLLEIIDTLEVKEIDLELENKNPKITVGTKIRLKTNPNVIISIIKTPTIILSLICPIVNIKMLKYSRFLGYY